MHLPVLVPYKRDYKLGERLRVGKGVDFSGATSGTEYDRAVEWVALLVGIASCLGLNWVDSGFGFERLPECVKGNETPFAENY